MKNYKIIIQYDGTRYNGWQKQGNTENTIQGKFENILTKMVGYKVDVYGSGRTDAGVHAHGQVANFKIDTDMTPEEILNYINEYLPKDIAVVDIKIMNEKFHSRLNAKGKKYLYRIYNNSIPNVFERNYVYHYPKKLNIEAMTEAARYFIGEHDFKSFCSIKRTKKSTVRIIYNIDIFVENGEISILFDGNGFLYNMVRIITGTLIEVGEGKLKPSDIEKIILEKDRSKAGYTVPPHGLDLIEVRY